MKRINTLAAAVSVTFAGALLAPIAFAGSALVPIDNEAPPRLIVEQPLSAQLANGIVYIPYRVENLRILPVGGTASVDVSPRVGHLHVSVDNLGWQWADYGQSNTIILIGMPRGEHTVSIDVVDPKGKVFTGQRVTFTTPGPASR